MTARNPMRKLRPYRLITVRAVALAALSFALVGCVQVTRPLSIELTRSGPRASETEPLPDYVSRRKAKLQGSSLETTFLVLKIDPERWSWDAVEDAENPKSVSAWQEALGAPIVMNAAYFTASGTPSGYWRDEPGTPKSRRPWPSAEAQADKAGYTGAVSIKDGRLSLDYLPEADLDPRDYDSIFLTYPTLVLGGTPAVAKESGLLARRTVLAEDAAGTDYAIVTEEGSATLYELSRWLAGEPENFVRAVNLDGGPSTGLVVRDGGAEIGLGYALVPNVLAIRRR